MNVHYPLSFQITTCERSVHNTTNTVHNHVSQLLWLFDFSYMAFSATFRDTI